MADDDKEPNDDDDAVMDSDEEDEDYDPTADPDAALLADEDENDAGAATGGDTTDDAPARLSITKQKAVDDAFFDLFGYQYNNNNSNAIPSSAAGGKGDDKLATKSNKRTMSKQRSILSSIFGRHSSVKLMTYAKATAAMARSKPCSAGGMLRLEKRTITEVKRFAGQEIKVEKVVMVPVMASSCEEENAQQQQQQPAAAAAAMQQSKTTQKPKGVDNLLTELSRPEKLSTISKTSTDWDLFKSKNADASLKEQLESRAEGNEAYLVKKDFLNRVDGRRFELEKKDRDRERSKRGK